MTFNELANHCNVDVIDITGDATMGNMIATGTILGDEIIAELKAEEVL